MRLGEFVDLLFRAANKRGQFINQRCIVELLLALQFQSLFSKDGKCMRQNRGAERHGRTDNSDNDLRGRVNTFAKPDHHCNDENH